jgi:hypothetical protein
MSDDAGRAAKLIRAREVLDGAGWLFDDFVNDEMRKVLTSDPDDMTAREIAYNRARVATEVKKTLMDLVAEDDANKEMERRQQEARDKLKEKTHGQ